MQPLHLPVAPPNRSRGPLPGSRGKAWGEGPSVGRTRCGNCSLHRCTLWFRAPSSSPELLILMWCWSDPSRDWPPCMASPTSPQTCTCTHPPLRPGGRKRFALEAYPTTSIYAGELQTGIAWADPGVEGGFVDHCCMYEVSSLY